MVLIKMGSLLSARCMHGAGGWICGWGESEVSVGVRVR